jgi:hypothetical protein
LDGDLLGALTTVEQYLVGSMIAVVERHRLMTIQGSMRCP